MRVGGATSWAIKSMEGSLPKNLADRPVIAFAIEQIALIRSDLMGLYEKSGVIEQKSPALVPKRGCLKGIGDVGTSTEVHRYEKSGEHDLRQGEVSA